MITQKHERAKKINLGSLATNTNVMTNPETSYGVYYNAEVRAKACAVDRARNETKPIDKTKKEETEEKEFKNKAKKGDSYLQFKKTIINLRNKLSWIEIACTKPQKKTLENYDTKTTVEEITLSKESTIDQIS